MAVIDTDQQNPLFQADFVTTLSRDLFGLVCGELIGSGVSRRVYAYSPNTELVIKFETGAGWFQNVLEWETWNAVEDTKYAKWFAPCKMISPCGTILVMKRTDQLPKKNYPKKMPVFFNDFKYNNFGLFDDRVVCNDYGLGRIITTGMTNRLRNADWWGNY